MVNNSEYTYQNKNNLFVWISTTIIVIAMVAGGIFYFLFPFYFLDNNRETIFMAFYITLAPLVIAIVFMMVSYYVSMLKINNQFNSYKISSKGFAYKHHMVGEEYREGYLDFSRVKRCVISREIVEVRKNLHYKDRFLVYPVIHLIYEENQQISHLMLQHEEYTKEAMNYLLKSLFDLHISIEFTERQLYLIPEKKLLEILDSKMKTRNLPIMGNIFENKEFNGYTSEKPQPEMGPMYKESLERRGIFNFRYPIWILFIVQFAAYLVIFGFAEYELIKERSIVFTNIIPYIVILSSYVLYVYRLKKTKYWKSILHWIYSQVMIVLAFFLVSTFIGDTFSEVVFEEVSFTNIGFHFASFIPYFITAIMIRSKWPAKYHEETKLAMEYER
ncbi:hypothetical protein [Paucisalibacillus globulus]|uniref:hypothetical protein n=1 Tax=Paucisalibacillus globulus TaxID=351095 RepID=UPI00040D0A8D|nr:hypothetical protein [Paucisalibacillus globulus]